MRLLAAVALGLGLFLAVIGWAEAQEPPVQPVECYVVQGASYTHTLSSGNVYQVWGRATFGDLFVSGLGLALIGMVSLQTLMQVRRRG